MSTIDRLKRRWHKVAQQKPHERVLTRTSRLEVMTSTQAVRFRQLRQLTGCPTPPASDESTPHYALPEASRRLAVPVRQILQSAATGRITCYILASTLSGIARTASPGPARATIPEYLAVRCDDCRDIESRGSANVQELLAPADTPGAQARFCLSEPLWVDPDRLVLRHPLPDPGGV